MITGRPSKYSDEILDQIDKYMDDYESYGHAIPSVAGLSIVLNISRTCLYDWASQPEKADFSYMLDKLNAKQEQILVSNGLKGDFNAAITKLVLGKHGYADKVEQTGDFNVNIPDEDAGTL